MSDKARRFRPDRLLKLAEHLETGKLGHRKFDFAVVNEGGTPRKPCGTSGCAIGELPIVFPRSWKFQDSGNFDSTRIGVRPPAGPGRECFREAAVWFGISDKDSDGLFAPFCRREWVSARLYAQLSSSPKPATVAASIRLFVKWKTKQLAASKRKTAGAA